MGARYTCRFNFGLVTSEARVPSQRRWIGASIDHGLNGGARPTSYPAVIWGQSTTCWTGRGSLGQRIKTPRAKLTVFLITLIPFPSHPPHRRAPSHILLTPPLLIVENSVHDVEASSARTRSAAQGHHGRHQPCRREEVSSSRSSALPRLTTAQAAHEDAQSVRW